MLPCQLERRKIMDYKFKTKPYAHQMTALEKSWNRETYAYFMEMGTGKTKVLIDNLAMLYDKGKVNGALIIAPKGVVGTWYDNELPTHLPDHIENVTVLWQANITKKQQESLDSLFAEGEGLQFGEGDLPFGEVIPILNNFPNRSFAIEVWKGHEEGGKGFKYFLDKLIDNGLIVA